jgi:hypothetical protein
MKKIYLLLVLLLQFIAVDNSIAQCTINYWGQYQTLTPICGSGTNGAWTGPATDCWTAEYDLVNVSAGSTYEFQTYRSSNNASRFGTIATTANAALAWGTTTNASSFTWTATFTGQVRFYTFNNNACAYSNSSFQAGNVRRVRCSTPAGGYNPCTTIPTISGCGTSATANMTGTGAGWSPGSCGWSTPGQERLFQFTAPTTGTYQLNVSAITGGFVDFFWKPASGGCNATGWNCIDDIVGAGTYNAITPMTFTAGTTYYILLDPEGTVTYNATFSLVCPIPPPANDNCAGAISLSCGAAATVNTANANTDAVGSTTCGTTITTPGVWYQIAGNGQQMTVSTVGLTASDTKLMVYSGSCAALACVGGSDDFSGTQSQVTWTSVSGTTYYVLAALFTGTGSFPMSLTCVTPTVANDNCSGASALTCGGTVTVNTSSATIDASGSGVCGTTITTPGVWYQIAGNGQQMTVSTVGLTASDTKLMVYSGSCAALACVGGSDDFSGYQSSVTWNSVSGTTYYVLAALYTGTGSFPMSLSCVAPCTPPSNDLCANAPILDLGANNNQTHLGTGACSTPNLSTYKDVFVAFTVPCGGMNVTIDFCGSTPVHNNAYLNIFPDCSFATFTGATTWDFTSCVDGNIKLYWNNVPAGTYYYPILIDPAWETNYVLNISGTPLYTNAVAPTSISGTTTVCSGQSTTLTLQGGSAGTNGVAQWFAGSCGSAVIGTGNSITVSPTVNTTYFVRYAGSCNTTACASVSVNLNSASTAPTLSGAGIICPNTTVDLVASGGIAGAGSQVAWYTGPNGTGTFLGFGNSFSFVPSASSIVYARREGTCNTTADASTSITIRDYVYAANNISSTNYCTDNSGWNHFYNGNDIILSVRGNLSSAGTVTALIRDNAAYFTDPGNAALCATGGNPGEAQFEMQRSWNVSYTGTLSGTYEVRYYFATQERQDVIDAAAAFMAANPGCAYNYKYNPGNNGWFWFKNNNVAYTAPSFDDNPNFALLSSTIPGITPNGLTYTEISGITGFSGGTGAIILAPNAALPVELISFSANCNETGDKVNVNWSTASEYNSSHFFISRSTDGVNWENINTQNAAINSTTIQEYGFVDIDVRGYNKIYYKLTQVDMDGMQKVYNVVVANCHQNGVPTIITYPNPSSNDFTIDFGGSEMKGDVQLSILNTEGKEISNREINLEEGVNTYQINNMELQPGIYYLKIVDTTGRSFIIKHSFI